jgi:hypothetical protein
MARSKQSRPGQRLVGKTRTAPADGAPRPKRRMRPGKNKSGSAFNRAEAPYFKIILNCFASFAAQVESR